MSARELHTDWLPPGWKAVKDELTGLVHLVAPDGGQELLGPMCSQCRVAVSPGRTLCNECLHVEACLQRSRSRPT